MKRSIVRSLFACALLASVTVAARAHETAPAPPVADIVPSPVPVQPDDARLVDIVRLFQSGMSESIITDQVKQSGLAYNLSVNDLRYLKEHNLPEPIISILMATRGASGADMAGSLPPGGLAFDDLVFIGGWAHKSRPGRLVLGTDALEWVDASTPARNFAFQLEGLEKVWFTCQARTPDQFCYEINFQIVHGDRYSFREVDQDSGSNESVIKLMDALRLYFPQIAFGKPAD
jgi:hypothetical protein